ncbi:MAG TPA: sulfotransferase [Mycobacterium sp.]|nr:sulfotransferase [Mycobacterium sp.]
MAGTRFYFDWANYRTMLRLLREEPNRSQRRKMYGAFLIGVPIVAAIHAICFALDPVLFPSLRRTQVRAPVFCVGHARSGTTYLHRMMAKDPQFSYVLMYEMFFPSLLEKRVLRALFRIDEVAFGRRLRRKLDAIEQRAFAETNDMHKTGFFVPEEDDFLLTWSLGSGFWIVMFPYMGELDFYHVDRWSAGKRRRMMTFYKECVRRQLALNGGGIHLSKNPTFCGRVESLIETFPDARFVVPVRNPYETIPSLLKMLQTEWNLRGRDDHLIRTSLRVLADQSFDSYEHPLEVLARHPGTRSCVVDYRDLVSRTLITMRRVYDGLGLELPATVAEAIESAGGQAHESTHRYSLEEFGLDPDEIHTHLADLFERFHWDTEGEDARVN